MRLSELKELVANTADPSFAVDDSGRIVRSTFFTRDIPPPARGIGSQCDRIDVELQPSMVPRMSDVQRARDATMADVLLAHSGRGAVLIAGAGHTRKDVGVPIYLASRMADKRVVSVGFVEVEPGKTGATDYARGPEEGLPYDYVWFTSPAAREDPCAGFTS